MPRRILIIGILFCFAGAFAMWDIISKLFNSHINLNFSVLLLPVGIGLLKGKPSSRKWAIFWIFLGYFVCLFVIVMVLISPHNATATWFEHVIRGKRAVPYVLTVVAGIGTILIVVHKLINTEKAIAYFRRNLNK